MKYSNLVQIIAGRKVIGRCRVISRECLCGIPELDHSAIWLEYMLHKQGDKNNRSSSRIVHHARLASSVSSAVSEDIVPCRALLTPSASPTRAHTATERYAAGKIP